MPELKPRPKGRPKMESGHKSTIVPVRFSEADRQRIENAALADGKPLSKWVRDTLLKALDIREGEV